MDDINPLYPKFDPNNQNVNDYEINVDNHINDLTNIVSISDVVICQTVHDTKFGCIIPAMKQTFPHIPWIMECDDHPFAIEATNPSFKYTGQGTNIERNAYDQALDSDGIIVSTEYLKYQFGDHSNYVRVIPNSLDFDIWGKLKAPKKEKEKVIIGWSGASGHLKDLSIVSKPLLHILEKYPQVEVNCLHGAIECIDHPRFKNENVWTNILDYPEKLASKGFDIGIAPLWDSDFNRAKSNLRYLEYSALKIPTVASNCGPYRETITHGEDGFLCNSVSEWVDNLSLMIENVAERKRIANSAYNLVQSKFNVSDVARDYADLLKEFVEEYRARSKTDVNIPAVTG